MPLLKSRAALLAAALSASLAATATADPLLTKAEIAKAAKRIEACLSKQASLSPGQPTKCIGLIKGECDDAISAGGEAAHATCSDNEEAAWDVLLNTAWSEFPADLSPKRFAQLKQIQKQWLAYREAKCGFLNDLEQVSGWGIMLEADCRMDETARRTLELRDILSDPNFSAAPE
jgi:uncharacterized protein YecT (DUF1311 family)